MASVTLGKEETLVVNLRDLTYIPAYREYEKERQKNEEIRIANENIRIENETERVEYYEEIKADVEAGAFNGKNTVYVGSETPVEDYYNVWIDENGEESTIPTKTSELTNDSGFITEEIDPTVPSWAKQSTKPSYSYEEIANTPTLPTKTSDLTNDSEFASESYVKMQ